MCKCIHPGLLCTHFVALVYWVWNFSFLVSQNFRSVAALSSVNSSHVLSSHAPNGVGNARESNPVFPRTTLNPNGHDFVDSEEFPLWIIVLIIVTVGLFLVACILCVIKLHRWNKDRGTYSMWNNQEPSLEAMCARESGVLFERLDLETSLAEAQCYEIPVDSFQAPQRIYIDGIRVTPLAESLEERGNERCLSDGEINVIDETQYCPAQDIVRCSSDVTGQRESIPSSIGPDASQHSSVSTSTVSDRGLTPGHETPNELYPKPLPVIPVAVAPTVLCETYTLDVDADQGRVSALVNRPLPQTPHLSPPSVDYSASSLDRTILKQQKEAKLEKPNTFRTLPRPRKIRQIPLPFFNTITRAASSTDVSKEAERLSDHVASDPKKCTLTRIKKRMSQSLDTLIASERVSHFYENPYLVEGTREGGKEDEGSTLGTPVEPPYSRVSSIPATSNENLPKDREHLYTRISQYMDGQESNINRHSYASVHYPSFRSRPKSKHVYISIIFGSADSVFVPCEDNPETSTNSKLTRTKSRSCPTFDSTTSQPNSDANNKYIPRPHSYYPPTDSSAGLYSIDTRNGRTQVPGGTNNDMTSFPDSQYQNIRESLGMPPLKDFPVPPKSTGYNGYQNLQESWGTFSEPSYNSAEAKVYKNPKSLDIRPYYENIACVRDNTDWETEQENSGTDIDTSHYGVPKSPPIPLQRFCQILNTASVANGESLSPQRELIQEQSKVLSKDDGSLEIWGRKRSAESAEKCAKNGERETLSTYLEGRFDGDEFNEQVETIDHRCESDEPTYENFISNNRDSYTSEESSSINDRLSLASSLSIDDKEIYENQPLIPKTSDVNGNSVCDGFVEKLEVRRNSLVGNSLFGESVA